MTVAAVSVHVRPAARVVEHVEDPRAYTRVAVRSCDAIGVKYRGIVLLDG